MATSMGKLKRAFTAYLQNLTDKSEELSASFTKAYEVTLSKHHNMFIRPIFSVCHDHGHDCCFECYAY